MKSNSLIIAALVATNVAMLAYFRAPSGRRIAEANYDRASNDLRREKVELTVKLAAAERMIKDLEKRAKAVGAVNVGKLSQARRRQISPAMIAERTAEQRKIVQRQYAAFIKKNALSDASAEALQQLIVELRQVPRDEFERRRAAGLPPATGDESRKIVTDAQQPVFDSIRTLLGNQGYSAFEYYNRTLTERQQLEGMLITWKASDEPLPESQFDVVVDALSTTNREIMAANGGVMPRSETADAMKQHYAMVVEKSRAQLSPAQLNLVQRAFDDDIALRRIRAAARAELAR